MNIDQAIERMTTIKDDIIHDVKHEAEWIVKDAMLNVEAIDKLIACGRMVVKGGTKVV